MTLLDAPNYNAARTRRLRIAALLALILSVLVVAFLIAGWNWPSEHRVNRFFAALEARDYPAAFGMWNNDPQWQAHPDRYTTYPYKRFLTDFGPSSDYGVIHSHRILYATSHLGNVVLIAVRISGNKTWLTTFAVSTQDYTIDFSAFDLTPGPKIFGYTRWHISPHFDSRPLAP
jgi:hypothetical protein